MGTPLQKVYDAFTSKILDDEWYSWDDDMVEADMFALLEDAIPYFKFPRISLLHNDEEFDEELTTQEIQILSSYMKVQWLNRCILTWNNLKPLYSEQDFSQANLIDKLSKLLSAERDNARKLENIYQRAKNGEVYPYRDLAGK